MSAAPIVVLGSVNTDFVVRGPKLPAPGETVLGGTFLEAPGGKGANQAVAAARLSRLPVVFLAAVGDDRLGAQSLAGFARENLDARFIRVVTGAASGVAVILVDERGENCISVASGANLLLTPDDIERLPDEVFVPGGVFLASLETPIDTVRRGLERARWSKMRTILNPAPADRSIVDTALLELVDVLTPNEHELAQLTGLPAGTNDEIVDAARVLQSFGAPSIVVTLGSRGAVVVGERAEWIAAESVRAIDTTAAGDAFSGALAVGLSEGLALVEAARWAGRAGALAVTRAGAQPSLPTRAELESFAGPGSAQVR